VHKVVWFLRFRSDGDRGELGRRWAEEHAALAVAVPGVDRYVQNRTVTNATREGASPGEPPFDGFAAFWFRDRDAYLAAVGSPQWQALVADATELFDVEWGSGMGAEMEERVVRAGLGANAIRPASGADHWTSTGSPSPGTRTTTSFTTRWRRRSGRTSAPTATTSPTATGCARPSCKNAS
jgi:uncharacterized protein (TIGR02118 family)